MKKRRSGEEEHHRGTSTLGLILVYTLLVSRSHQHQQNRVMKHLGRSTAPGLTSSHWVISQSCVATSSAYLTNVAQKVQ